MRLHCAPPNQEERMANQNDRGSSGKSGSSSSNRSGHVDQNDSSQENRTDKLGRDPVIGRGMSSPDSTEAVLDASTGEPDPRARGEGSLPSGDTRGQGGSRSAEQESHLSAGKSGGKKNSRS
jgi:hypothetical protein